MNAVRSSRKAFYKIAGQAPWMNGRIEMKIPSIIILAICTVSIVFGQNVTSDRLLLTMGDMLLENREYAKAIEQYQKSIAIKPSAEAYNDIGVANASLNKYPEAAAAYKQAVSLKPADAILRSNLGDAYFELGRYDDSIGQLKEAVRLRPNLAAAFNTLGMCYFRLERFSDAEAAYRQAVALDTKQSAYERNLVKTYVELRRTSDALALNEELIKLDPQLGNEMAMDIQNFLGP